MAFYRTCPYCGASLDPGERCNCQEEKERVQDFLSKHLTVDPEDGQLVFILEGRDDHESKSFC